MKKILGLTIIILSLFSTSVSAFELTDVGPDNTYIEEYGINIEDDLAYLDGIANSFSDRFVVSKMEYCDVSDIDRFYTELSKPMTVEELDKGKNNLDTGMVVDEELRKRFNLFKTFGGLAGYKAEFEPVSYYKIYRNISLVGGYTRYTKTFFEPDKAYWKCVSTVENLTKEIINYDTRIKMFDKITELNSNIDSDNSFKIFILVDGKVNSVWKRSSVK